MNLQLLHITPRSTAGTWSRIVATCLVAGLAAPACSDNGQATDSASSGGATSSGGVTSSGGDSTTSGGMTTAPTSSTTLTTAGSESDSGQSSSEAMTTASSGPAPTCDGNPDCGGDTPYCIDMACVDCTSLSCADVEPGKPACEPESGLCVECIADADCVDVDKPACNAVTATCEPCSEHDQCPGTACDLESGQCFPADNVLFVENAIDKCSDAKPDYGSVAEQPICTLGVALARAVVGKPLTIKLKPAVKAQSVPAALPIGDFIVAIVPQDALAPTLLKSGDAPALTVSVGNKVFMSRVTVLGAGNVGPAVVCSGARLWLDRQRFTGVGTALEASDCALHLRRTVVFASVTGGLSVGGSDPAKATLRLENSFLTENNGSAFGGLRLKGAASAEIVYSTIALNKSVVPPIDCANDWTGALKVENSAIVGAGPHFGAGCNDPLLTHSLESMEADKAVLKQTTFSGFLEGVYLALDGGVLKDVAENPGTPNADYDDTPRPFGADYAGADRP